MKIHTSLVMKQSPTRDDLKKYGWEVKTIHCELKTSFWKTKFLNRMSFLKKKKKTEKKTKKRDNK